MRLFRFNASTRSLASQSVVTIGNFDGVHRGHQAMLARMRDISRAHGDTNTTLITFEPHPRDFFARQRGAEVADSRISGMREKAYWLRKYGLDQLVIIPFTDTFSALSPQVFVRTVLSDFANAKSVVIGEDFRYGTGRSGDLDSLRRDGERLGFDVNIIDEITLSSDQHTRISSTRVRDAIVGEDLETARSLLGHPINIIGRVVHGDALGRTLGFPTANIAIEHKGLVFSGVYAVKVRSEKGWDAVGVANIGSRPTISGAMQKRLEIHLFEFSSDCYGEQLCVELCTFIRPQHKYNGLDELTQAISADTIAAKKWFDRNALEG